MRTLPRLSPLACGLAALLLAASSLGAPAPAKSDGAAWAEVERLASEQKFQEAADKVAALRAAAQAAADPAQWTRALVKETQLRTALHGYETAVRLLKEQPWPADPTSRAVLDLYYAHQLVTYARAYSWEIRQRERVDTKGAVDLKAWTFDQLYAEAQRAYQDVWTRRVALGGQPVSSLSEYLEPNTYPAGIRDTLRDAVSYLRVELLADTSGWRPEQSNEVFELDRAWLVKGDPSRSAKLALDDPAVHPLLKLAAVLDDLEGWHAQAGRKAAALEARLERARRMHAALSEPDDRALVVADLKARLPSFAGDPWWSTGMALLARFTEGDGGPQPKVRARAIALEGQARYPSSPGGQQCGHIVEAIEAPSYRIEAMASDAPGERSLSIQHRNLRALHVRAFPYDLEERLGKARNYNLLPDSDEMQKLLGQKPAAQWQVDLPATPDYELHRTYAVPPLKTPGAYLLVTSARADFSPSDNQLFGLIFTLSDLVLVERPLPGELEVSALSGQTGMPLPGVTVDLYVYDWNRGHHRVDRKTSGADGAVRFKRRREPGNPFLFARRGADLALDPNYLYFPFEGRPSERTSALVFTDRSVYRPTQKLFWKVVGYSGRADLARWTTLPKRSLTVSLLDANGQTVETRTVTTNGFGSAAGEFLVPAGRMLGRWTVQASLGGAAAVQIEEYKRPTFEVSLKEPEETLRLNREATLRGEARYYFGLPVAGGSARWKVVRTPVFPWWWGWWWPGGNPGGRTQIVETGTSRVEDDGSFELRFVPKADERQSKTPGMSYRYSVSVDLTDEGGETRSAERAFRLGFVAVEAAIAAETGFLPAHAPAELSVTRTDLDGAPRPGRGSWRLYALQQPEKTRPPADQPLPRPPEGEAPTFQTAGDELRPRHAPGYSPELLMRAWSDGALQAQGEVVHDAQGKARVALGKLAPGAYRLRYETVDDFGARYQTFKEVVVAGPKTPLALPLVAMLESGSVPVGGKARLLVHSGLPTQLITVDIYQSGKRIEQRRLVSGRDGDLIEIPVTEKLRGGFAVEIAALRDHQLMEQRLSVLVPWDDKRLEVSFSTFRDRIRPGAKETWRVTVKAPSGRLEAGTSELLAYMYDRSLDLFAPHRPPSALALYPNRAQGVDPRSSLGPAQVQYLRSSFAGLPSYPTFAPDRLKFYDSYGVGGPGRRGCYGYARRNGDLLGAMPPPAPMAAPPARQKALADGVARVTRAAEAPAEFAGKELASAEPADKAEAPSGPAPQMRSNFSETAFWLPQLRLDKKGEAAIEFTVPDSVTSWKVWAHALTRDLKAGSLETETKSVKDLMVRPYLPRFLREGDEATLKVVVNNASDKPLSGQVALELLDPETGKSVLADFGLANVQPQAFTVGPDGGANVSFAIKAPKRVGQVNVKVVAAAGSVSDGELRALPLLPSRLHLAQSRFVTVKGASRRELTFADMARNDDPTLSHEQLVVTLDAQLFYGVLSALPYLVNYPYECTEQTLNRFVSTGIVTGVYKDFPAVARMAEQLARRETPLETFEGQDPNRKLALEETPWVVESKGGKDAGLGLVNVLDPRAAKAERESALAKLRKAQTASGGFPWWPGGPPSPYMTLYILYGFAKAAEFGVDVPKDVIRRGWAYLGAEYSANFAPRMIRESCCWEFLTFLNYVASCYPDPSWTGDALTAKDRAEILDFTFKRWKSHSPYLKSLLSLTLQRAQRPQDARLVFDSVMDSAKTTPDEGTSWAPEDRAWLWYNDTIETHAFALRTLTELEPKDPRREGLVQWLFLNKKLNHWKSTKATAEVIYSLVHYLKAEGQLSVREDAQVTIGPRVERFVFEPDKYTGKKNQVVVPGEQLDPRTMSTVVVEKTSPGFLFASATWHFATDRLPAEGRGDLFAVSRTYFKRETSGREVVLKPLTDGARLAPGDELEVQLSIKARHPAEYVHLRDPRGAGLEPVSTTSKWRWDLGLSYYEEVRDSATNFFFESLPQGEYTLKYRLRAAHGGTFRVGPATLQSMYAPEFTGYSAGHTLGIANAP